ncbi:GntR family transcriptional regulator [Microvirga sp. SRT01]|jgi:DNA-binding GntR family transcriptional regulator|uniref:GntR family transcriptional regulator n=1 Tax=Sphingomonas longa TaxID=2778730 RepID=A0ABS2D4V4_9SPHN|nr:MULTISPECIES: GntR family transcriptional regulator [Alphaproteobacteria]MBM6575948.1 GntR family transcriptional regulator [Sphingomonas sp. BT552]MBR7708994.1 GntR family transcriptional regulator [Microvirga sp. SRT01]
MQRKTAETATETEDRPPARKGDRHQEAVTMLRRMILAGELAPGEPLREVALSEQFGTSRTPVREALRTLAAEGLVTLLPNRTVQVSQLDEQAASEVFTVLGALESLAARLACERMGGEDMEVLSELQEDMARYFESRDRPRYLEANRQIHELIVESSGNASLILAWRLLLPRAERARHVSTLDHERWEAAFEEHKLIEQAFRARDVPAIAELMQSHFDNGADSIKNAHRRARREERSRAYQTAAGSTPRK